MKQLLMVAFHYPPIAASAGALRTCAFASHLPRHGWHAHVLTPTRGAYAEIDEDSIPPSMADVYRCWALDARRHLGWRGRYPECVAIPDRWSSWAPAAIARGLHLINKHRIEAIWSTYPIATSHLIGGTLARVSGLPWISEFRDPVGLDKYQPAQRWVQAFVEHRAVRAATRSVFVTPGALADYGRRFPAQKDRFLLIPNGYDESIEPADPAPERAAGPIRILHSGHLYQQGRNPAVFLEAIAGLKQRGEIDADRLQIIFRNSQEEGIYQEQIDRLDLSEIVTLQPRIPHAEALREQRGVDGLLLLQGAAFNRQIPAKLFEYLRARRPVLALVDDHGDTATLLDELGGARRVAPDDAQAIADALLIFMQDLRAGRSDGISRYTINEAALAGYSRARQAGTLAELLSQITASSANRS